MKPGTNMAPVPMHVLEPNQNADFGGIEIFILCFSETNVRHIITAGTACEK